jgi:putative addiction module killer protein
MDYNCGVIELKQTEAFRKWFAKLRGERTITAIVSRLDRLAFGHAGDVEPVGKGVSKLRIHYGPGYRVYFQRRWQRDHRPAVRRRQRIAGAGHQDRAAPRR